jgi:hypothetical protein
MARASSIWEQLFGTAAPDYAYPPGLYGPPLYDQPPQPPPMMAPSQLSLPPLPPTQGYGSRPGPPSVTPDLLPQQLPLVGGAPGMPTFSPDMATQPVLPPAHPAGPSVPGHPGLGFLNAPVGRLIDYAKKNIDPQTLDYLTAPPTVDIAPGSLAEAVMGRSGRVIGPPKAPSTAAPQPPGYTFPPDAISPAAGQLGGVTTDATSAPPLPPPIDIASRAVGGAPANAVATNDPFKLPVGGTTEGNVAPTDVSAARTVAGAQGQPLPDVHTAARQILATTTPSQLYAPPESPGAFDRFSAFMHNLGNTQAGGFGAIADAIGGVASGQRMDPQGMGLAAQNNMYRALLQRGYTQDMAMAGATNPEILKQMMAPSKWTVIGEGIAGQKRYGFVNEQQQLLNGQTLGAGGGTGGGVQGNYTDAQWDAMTSEQRLATLPKADQSFIKSIYEAKAMPSPRVTGAIPAVTAIYPDFDQQDYFKRHETLKSFEGQGKNALEKKALNTAIAHADNLYSMIDELPNTTWFPGYVNPFIHALKANTGDTRFQQLRGRWDAQSEGLANELSKMLNGGQTSESDRQNARAILAMAKSPEELKASIHQLMDMAQGRANSLQSLYDQGMKQPIRDGLNMVDPANQQVFMRLRGLQGGTIATPQGQVAPTQAPALIQGHIPPPPAGFHILQ